MKKANAYFSHSPREEESSRFNHWVASLHVRLRYHHRHVIIGLLSFLHGDWGLSPDWCSPAAFFFFLPQRHARVFGVREKWHKSTQRPRESVGTRYGFGLKGRCSWLLLQVRLQALAHTSLTRPPICMYIFINSKTPPNIFNPIMASQRQRKYLLTRSSLSPKYMFFNLRPPQVERAVWRWKSSSEWNYVNHLFLISGH